MPASACSPATHQPCLLLLRLLLCSTFSTAAVVLLQALPCCSSAYALLLMLLSTSAAAHHHRRMHTPLACSPTSCIGACQSSSPEATAADQCKNRPVQKQASARKTHMQRAPPAAFHTVMQAQCCCATHDLLLQHLPARVAGLPPGRLSLAAPLQQLRVLVDVRQQHHLQQGVARRTSSRGF